MKKIALFLLAFSTLSVFAQNEHLENSKWVNGYYEIERNPRTGMQFMVLQWSVKYCTDTADTTFNGINYLQLFDCGQPVAQYKGAIRIDSIAKRWYYYDGDSTNEVMLYDFGLEVGDTLKDRFYTENARVPQGKTHYVTQIDTMDYNGVDRRVFYFDGDNNDWSWIEGVGNPKGLLWDPFTYISQHQTRLECYSKADSVLVGHQNSPGACNLSFSLSEQDLIGEMTLYPNPTQSEVNLVLGKYTGQGTLKIYDALGREVHMEIVNNQVSKLSLNLKPGVYQVQYLSDAYAAHAVLTIQ